jgi:hypothetical protein
MQNLIAPISESEHDAAAGATEIELGVGDWQAEYFEVLECMEVADIASHTHVLAEVTDDPAADIPPEMVVIGFQKAAQRHFRVTLDQTKPNDSVRLYHTKLRRQHEVAHEGQHV